MVSLTASSYPADCRLKVVSKVDDFQPYNHQRAAWDQMSRHYLEEEQRAGLVVVPTGGGKTLIAARWLLENFVSQGARILWLAHRRSLLLQAFQAFVQQAHRSAPRDVLQLIRISSEDMRWNHVAPDHDIAFSTIQSAAMEGNIGFVDTFAEQSRHGTFVVVDEAHHASAPSYGRLLKMLAPKFCRTLGLTATPVRIDEEDTRRLWSLFGRHKIYEIAKKTLIERKILAVPHLETVRTRVEPERDFTDEDYEYLEKFNELGPKVLERLAQHAGRNERIVEHYRQNALKYGKTIVFAASTAHARTLAQEFQKAGITADYVDYQKRDNQSVMTAFRDRSEPAVIVNVEILTEGFDAPRTQTIFIARPTRSEALLSQMIGRALRGEAAGGTSNAYLVTFVDTWQEYDVLDTEVLVPEGEVTELAEAKQAVSAPLERISDELLSEIYKLIQSNFRGFFEGVYDCLPHAWYVWEEETEEDINRRLILVFANQQEGYDTLHREWVERNRLPADVTHEFASRVRRECFHDTPDPRPSLLDVYSLLDAYANGLDVGYYTFDERERFAPEKLAQQMKDKPPTQWESDLRPIYDENPACRLVYRNDFPAFFDDVYRAVQRIASPERKEQTDTAVPASALATRKPAPWPEGQSGYELEKLWQIVAEQKRHFPNGVPKISDISFSERPLSRYFGFYRLDDHTIVISSLLNSPDVPLFVVEFLVYHELLHADMPSSGHNQDFRERERRFQPSAEAVKEAEQRGYVRGSTPDAWRVLGDQFLDTFHRTFSVPYVRKPIDY